MLPLSPVDRVAELVELDSNTQAILWQVESVIIPFIFKRLEGVPLTVVAQDHPAVFADAACLDDNQSGGGEYYVFAY